MNPRQYSETGVYRGIHYSLIFALKHILCVLVRTEAVLTCTHNICFEQKYENSKNNQMKIVIFQYNREKSLYIAWAYFRNIEPSRSLF